MDWIKHHYPIDWWLATLNWQAKMLVVQSVAVKVACIGAIAAWLYVGVFIAKNVPQIIAFRIWTNELWYESWTWKIALALAVLVASVFAMTRDWP